MSFGNLKALFSSLFLTLTLALTLTSVPQAHAASPKLCADLFRSAAYSHEAHEVLKSRGTAIPERAEITRELAKFALENGLPMKWVEVGPPEQRIRRLFVALDWQNEAVVHAYLQRFNLDRPFGKNGAGTLALEFASETAGQWYVTGVLRPSADPKEKIYRWGRPDLTRENWWQSWILGNQTPAPAGIRAFAHLIELNHQEQENVKFYLQHSDVNNANEFVCRPKSDNCVAWTANIELGKTAPGATAEERRHLLPELGVARAMAHFEIGRRLIHAANNRHTAILVFVDGEKGLDTFKNDFERNLPPDPKIPYASIIKGLQFKSPATAAIAAIPDGAKIFFPIAAGASPEALAALADRAGLTKNGYDVHVLVNGVSANDFKKGIETSDGKFRVHALFLGGNLRQLYKDGKVAVIPGNLSDFTRMVRDREQTEFHYDAMVVRVSKPDAEGRYSLGPNNDMIMSILKARPDIKIIAEVNENVPFTTGENFLTENQITAKFESKTELAGPASVPPSEVDAKIGNNIGKLIDSGATLQIGIGNIFSGVPDGLQAWGKGHINISTEMFGDPMMEMIKRGTVHKAETGFAYGTMDMYRWLDKNPKVIFKETEYVNSPGRVAETPKFHAVNTALQVNLFGEVNATMGPDGRISSPGGQVEFMTGAARSEGGKAIIAIRSTAKNDQLSTIVLDLYKGPITTPHESVTHVVTEYGIASLRGKNEPQRAAALISIAHPKFRPELIRQAIERGFLTEAQSKNIPLN